jgi:hypothetical protein
MDDAGIKKGKIAVGFSAASDVEQALKEVSRRIRQQLDVSGIDICYVFFNFSSRQLERLPYHIKMTLNPRISVGVQTPILIYNQNMYRQGLAAVAFSGFETGASVSFDSKNMGEATEKYAWRMSQEVSKTKSLYLGFSNVEAGELSSHMQGLEIGIGTRVRMVNGFMCPGVHERRQYLLSNEQLFERGATGGVFCNDLESYIRSTSGFQPLGNDWPVTEAEGNVIKTIKKAPAINFYKRYFGDRIAEDENYARRVFSRYPLGYLIAHGVYGFVRPLRVLPEGELVFLHDITFNRVRLMIPTREGLLQAASMLATKTRLAMDNPQVVLMFDTMQRYAFFGNQYQRQVRAVKEVMGKTELVGGAFYGTIHMIDSERSKLGHIAGEYSCTMMALGAAVYG